MLVGLIILDFLFNFFRQMETSNIRKYIAEMEYGIIQSPEYCITHTIINLIN